MEYMTRIWEKKKKEQPILNLGKMGVRKRYQPCSFDNFKGMDSLVADLKRYKDDGMVLRGKTGVGKTHLAVALMKHLYNKKWLKYCDNGIKSLGDESASHVMFNFDMRFVTVPDLLLEIRESFREGSKNSERDLINKYANIPFLVLDDLGSEKGTEYTITTLYILIEHRDADMRDTVITTNLTQSEIEEKLNARIASRLARWDNKTMDGIDYRKGK